MENWERILLIIIILVSIILLDLFLYFKTDKLINDTQVYLSKLEEKIDNEKLSNNKNETNELNNKWQKNEKVLSFFIEHDELEKVSSKIVVINENIKNEEYEDALEDIAEAKYILEHIKNKYNLNLKNIF